MAFSHKTRTDPPTGDQRNIKTGGLSPNTQAATKIANCNQHTNSAPRDGA